jgi:glycosyltransferase involved in cell wall biosynthesis
MDISIIIPVYNEVEALPEVYRTLKDVLDRLEKSAEIYFIDDGSKDGSGATLDGFASSDDRVQVLHLRRNYGQTAAMMAGFQHCTGDVIIPMDGDGQNDPADIPRLLDKLSEGFDVVSGWRTARNDKFSRRVPSTAANWLISSLLGVPLHDYGCTLKAYRREVVEDVRLYGEMHRFIPIYAHWMGATVAEVPVRHNPRRAGKSKYGLERIIKVFLDLLVVKFLDRHFVKPIYVFGGFGLFSILISSLSFLYMLYLKFVEGYSMILTPLPLLTAMTLLVGILSILMGLVAEMLVRTYFESQGRSAYLVREFINFETDD